MSEIASPEKWFALVETAHEYLSARQEQLKQTYRLGQHQRFDWDQQKGTLTFANDGVPAVVAQVQFVGSLSPTAGTWMWSWANLTVLKSAKDQMLTVKAFGEREGFEALSLDSWDGDEADGWDMTSISAYLLNAPGAYRASFEKGFAYMVITGIDWLGDAKR